MKEDNKFTALSSHHLAMMMSKFTLKSVDTRPLFINSFSSIKLQSLTVHSSCAKVLNSAGEGSFVAFFYVYFFSTFPLAVYFVILSWDVWSSTPVSSGSYVPSKSTLVWSTLLSFKSSSSLLSLILQMESTHHLHLSYLSLTARSC